MERKQKIKMLQALKEGKLQLEDLRTPVIYVFWQKNEGESEHFEMEGNHYTPSEMQNFIKANELSSLRRMACGLEEDTIIVVRYGDEEKHLVNKKPIFEE